MPRAGTLLGSLRSLFKPSRNGSHRIEDSMAAGVADVALASEPASANDQASDPSTHVSYNNYQDPSPVALSKDGPKTASASNSLPKAFHRKLFSRSFLPTRSPLSISEQSAICHSLSDPFEDPSKAKSRDAMREGGSTNACGADGARLPAKSSRLIMTVRDADSPLFPSPDATLSATYDNTRRCLSLDIPVAGLTSPAAIGKPQRLLLPVVLASAAAASEARPMEQCSPSLRCSIDVPAYESRPPAIANPAVPPPPSSNTTLLALCPGTPAAMRRRQWCVEDYEVSRKLYKGATSTVYKATCRRSGLPVALKVYFLSKVPKNVLHMIVREIKIHVELVQKHIVMLYAAFQDEKRLVLVQEFAGRGDLYGIYRSLNRRMTEAQLIHLVLAPFMDALWYLHARGYCHRDIKPENVLFTNDWRLLVADFGVSIDLNQERAVTRAGTLEYMAPEVERCPLKMLPEDNKDNLDLAYTTAVDIWAVGVLAYELLVGFPPYVGADRAPPGYGADALGGSGTRRPPLCFPASTSQLARDFIGQALAERPEERPTALQLLQHPWLAPAVQQVRV